LLLLLLEALPLQGCLLLLLMQQLPQALCCDWRDLA
jgi:hypothetical protein